MSCHNHLNEKLNLDVSELNGLDTLVDKYDNNGFDSDLSPSSNVPLIRFWSTLFGFLSNRNNGVYRFLVVRKVDENSTPILMKQTIHTDKCLRNTLRENGINSTQDNENNTAIIEDYSTNIYNASVKTNVQQNLSQNTTRNIDKNSKTIKIKQILYPKDRFDSNQDNKSTTSIMNNHLTTVHNVSVETGIQQNSNQNTTKNVEKSSSSIQVKHTFYPKDILERIFRGIKFNLPMDNRNNSTIINNSSINIHNTSVKTGIRQNLNRNTSRDVEQNSSHIEKNKFDYPQKNFKRHSRGIDINLTQDNSNNTTILNTYSTDVCVKTDNHKYSRLIRNVDNNSSPFEIKQTVYPKNIPEKIFKGKDFQSIRDNENNSTTIVNENSTNIYNASVKTDIQQNTRQSVAPDVAKTSQILMYSKMDDTKMLEVKSNRDQSHTFPTPLTYDKKNKADTDKISGEISSSLLSHQGKLLLNYKFTFIKIIININIFLGINSFWAIISVLVGIVFAFGKNNHFSFLVPTYLKCLMIYLIFI